MKITCPACNAKYSLPDERVQGKNKVFKIPCKRCGAEIRVRGLETAEEVGRTTLPFALDLPPQQAAAPVPIWFAGIDGKQVGPMTEAEVVEHITAGRLGAADLVWRKGFTAWTPVKDVAPFDDMVSAAPGVPTPDPAAAKKSPRRAQTLELSAAMIELLVKLDGQQGGEPDLPPDLGTVEPPNLPPLEPEPTVVAARPTPAKTPSARVAGDAKAAAALDEVETAVSPVPPRPVENQPAVRVSEPVPVAAKPVEAKRESVPTPAAQTAARADLPLPAEATQAEPALPEPSVKIRLPEDKIRPAEAESRSRTNEARTTGAAAGKDAGKVDIKPVLPAARSESKPAKTETKTEAKPAAKTAAAPAGKAAPATTGSGKQAPPAKKAGPPMGLIAGGGAAVVGIIAVVIAMSGKPAEKPATTEPAAATADVAPSAPAVDAQAAAPSAAPDVAAAAPEADVVAAAPQADVVAAAEDVQAPKVEAAKIDEGKADEAKKAEEAKAAEAKKVEDAKAAEAKKAEDAKAEEAKRAEAKKNAEEAKKAADEAKKQAAEAKKQAAEEAKAKKADADAKRKADAEAANEKKKAAAEETARKRQEAADAKKAAAEEAKRKKDEEAARKKAEADAKVAAAEAKSKKPTVSDEDLDKILQKHDAKKNAATGGGEESSEAGLSQQQVSAIGEKAKKKVANCYLLNADDPVEDTIKVQVLVNASGQIERATVLGKHGANKAMAQCIADEVKKLVFPTGSGASKKYTLPFRVGG